MQPLDVSVFGPAKAKWKREIDAHFRRNGLVDITNQDFPALMKTVYFPQELFNSKSYAKWLMITLNSG